MQASRINAEEALRTGFIEQVVESNDARDDLRTPPDAGNMSGDEVVIVTCTYNVD